MSKKYNGHASYNAWNVSLWVNNDESIYNMAREYARNMKRDAAALAMLEALADMGITQTPDGVPYTKTNIKRAMCGM